MRAVWMAGLLCLTLLAGCASVDTPAPTPEPVAGTPSAVAPGTASVFDGDWRFDNPLGGSLPLDDGIFGIAPVATVVLESALDGVDIDISYWLPTTADDGTEPGAVPLIIQASPYFVDTSQPFGSQQFGQWMHDVFVPHGYAYVQLAIRSTAGSGGCDDFRGPNMVADMDQAIDWLVAQDWAEPSVALIGKSYPGSTPWYAAGAGNEAIKTIVPTSGSTNAWEVYNRNGTPEVRSAIIVPNYGATAAANTDRSPAHKVENFACVEVYQGWANGVGSGLTGERLDDAWWDERNSKPAVEANYEGSIFLVHGLEDWNVDPAVAIPWTQQLADSGLEVKQWLGQWAHDWPDQGSSDDVRRYDFGEVLLRWFDRELKGEDVDVGPPVQVQSNDGRWRDELAWPPKDAEQVKLHLSAWSLGEPGSGDQLLAANSPHEYVFDVEEDLRIAGLPLVHLDVRPHGTTGYFGARLIDVAPDGTEKRIGWTGMNLRYADGTENPSTVVPEQWLMAKAQIQPMDAIVPAGHQLILRIDVADAPSDRIPAPGAGTPMDIGYGEGRSVLVLPVVERDEAAFFEPPMPQ